MMSIKLLSFCMLIALCPPLWASVYMLPENGDNVVGHIQYRYVTGDETLLDIARMFDLGYNEIMAANPGVNPWVPKDNYRVVVPTQFVLPPKPWRGIVINLPEMRLYYFPPASRFDNKRVFTMPLSIGKINWQTPTGNFFVTGKIKGPSWTVPESIVKEYGLERYGNQRIIPPGDDSNPLGDYAILLNKKGYLIHGTNKPFSIGRRVSHGCIRLYPENISILFDHVDRNTPVRIIKEPVKVGRRHNRIFVEAHGRLAEDVKQGVNITPVVKNILRQVPGRRIPESSWRQLDRIVSKASGMPISFLELTDQQVSQQDSLPVPPSH
ncbi:MAG: L,D-transpeptidase family protein [Gammaproteobacteria bacterium]|jgi:L,D-transpeptidase ErfK/SrfK